MSVKDNILKRKELSYERVEIQDAVMSNAFRLELNYLKELEADRLLAGFRETAGRRAKAMRYPGWESTEIQGHTLGHYLTALSQAYGQCREAWLLERIDYIIAELKLCQAGDGYLFASGRELFDRVENKKPVWVPWYTMHKIMEGLLAAYRFTGSGGAMEIMTGLGRWICLRCKGWSRETRNTVLSVEYGGMNDCLYDLYQVTGAAELAEAAHQFDELPLFEAMERREDILNGLHANTTIPKIIGALKRYIVLGGGEPFYLRAAENFWEMVVGHHTYITGGNSEWEHFGEPDILDGERTACNCETCNSYNMLKLTKLLFCITGDKKYADYYERALINSILSSQNPRTGMTTYFQPMATGFFKVYGTPFDRFWCCTGSGMENFTKLTEGIYFYQAFGEEKEAQGRLIINLYLKSSLKVDELNLKAEIEADFMTCETVTVRLSRGNQERESKNWELALRIPEWADGKPDIRTGGSALTVREEDGYLVLAGGFREEETIQVTFPMGIRVHALADNEDTVAFTYGPYVLSAGLGRQMMDMDTTGVDVLVPKKDIMIKDYVVLEQMTIPEWKARIRQYLVKTPGKMEFRLQNGQNSEELIFTPHYSRSEERYGIYFRLFGKDSPEFRNYRMTEKKRQSLRKIQIDTVPIGNDQYELAHGIQGFKTDTIRDGGHRGRYAKKEGWFSYRMKITDASKLCVIYSSADCGDTFDILIDGSLFVRETVTRREETFYTKEYPLPAGITNGNDRVCIRFQPAGNAGKCRIFDELYVKA